MFPIVELPEIVKHYAGWFEPVFSEEAWVQFQRYISGLIVSENKTIDGINRLIIHENRNQSSLNRLLTAGSYSEKMLNQQRLALLGNLPGTVLKKKGVLSIDDTLLSHYGRHFEKIAKLWDPVERHYTWAHKLVTLHYSDEQTDYPLFFQLWEPVDLERIEMGLLAVGIPLRKQKFALKESNPRKWRQYLLGVWRRKQEQPAVDQETSDRISGEVEGESSQQVVQEEAGETSSMGGENPQDGAGETNNDEVDERVLGS